MVSCGRGCSLPVVTPLDDGFTIAVIPHTMEVTTLGRRGPGDRVNLEVDVMAKYAEKLLAGYAPPITAPEPRTMPSSARRSGPSSGQPRPSGKRVSS